ncbi:MAG: histidinol-phosphatase [Actinomycetota bacterium]|nr:histidinol-phosphatase [Actinomycetota bacterium]
MFEEELRFAGELADHADRITLEVFSRPFEVRQKADQTPVTEADVRVEEMIRAELATRFPGDAVLGEEGGLEGASGRVWVIDPVDGTKNFTDRIQVWGTLVALMVEGQPVVGVASAPALGERYAASRGGGATLNGQAIRVSSTGGLAESMVCSSGMKDWLSGPFAGPYRAVVETARRSRGFGDFWGHMLVARGSADAMLETILRTWDFAAVQVIVEEAGGRMTTLDGAPLADQASALTTNGALHNAIVELFTSLPEDAPGGYN